MFVLFAGLATTALALFGVYAASTASVDFFIMGWYAFYVIPIGAILVGLVASSGYGLAAWHQGVKISSFMLWGIVGTQALAYFGGQYVEFLSLGLAYDDGTPLGFPAYFDLAARNFAWVQDDGSVGTPFGVFGYVMRGLEIAGFCGGSLIPSLILSTQSYCGRCELYMKNKQLVVVPASVPERKVKKMDIDGQAAYEAEQEQAYGQGIDIADHLAELGAAGDTRSFREQLTALRPADKAAKKLPVRIVMSLASCPRCRDGELIAKLLTGQGENISSSDLANYPLSSRFIRLLGV